MRSLTGIIVHCFATRPEWMASRSMADKMAEVKRWHVDGNGWSDIGYHFGIDRDGTIARGRPIERTGAHTLGRNKGTIGIALAGGHGSSETDQFDEHFTPEQDASLRALIGELQSEYGQMSVTGHNQYSAKACPGFQVPDWYRGGAVNRKYIPPEAEALVNDANKPASSSSTVWALLTASGGTIAATWEKVQEADPQTLLAVAVITAALIYVFRERIRKAAMGKSVKEALGL